MTELERVGWDDGWLASFKEEAGRGLSPARVWAREGSLYRLVTEHGERVANISGRYKLELGRGGSLPAVGDWVAADLAPTRAVIRKLLPRRTTVARKEAGERERMQVLAANVDVILVVSGLDADFNPRRLERYLAMARESGARPVLVLNKADLCPDVPARVEAAKLVAGGAPMHVVSAKPGLGLEALDAYLRPGQTLTLLGSSGAGKSTLVNRILGRERQATKEIREDGRGRHTTTSREMFVAPSGAILMDTPGLREIQLADVSEGIRQTFEDVEALLGRCRFADCRHHKEPGCAVLAALHDGTLDHGRWDSYLKLRHETELRNTTYWEARRLKRKHDRLVDEAEKRKKLR
ncbi:MAG: ribosome small subunit-dependent GTPase A [Elusimicrobia bacterium]|nr:ribosome small subunit-dependent GTPase A [Elusimicrobiota bacterium]